MSVFDRPKTVVIECEGRHVTKWNTTFMSVIGELGVGRRSCAGHHPQQKGAVENLVGG